MFGMSMMGGMGGMQGFGGMQGSGGMQGMRGRPPGPPPHVRKKIQEFMQDGKIDSSERAQLEQMRQNDPGIQAMQRRQEIFSDGKVTGSEKQELHQMMQQRMQMMGQFNGMGGGMYGMFG